METKQAFVDCMIPWQVNGAWGHFPKSQVSTDPVSYSAYFHLYMTYKGTLQSTFKSLYKELGLECDLDRIGLRPRILD